MLAARAGETPLGSSAPFAPTIAPAVAFGFAAPRSALAVTAQRWADLDPRRALAVARSLEDERVRLAFETAALSALARIAPNEAFAQLADLNASALQPGASNGTLVELARADPERLLRAVRELPRDARGIAEQVALQELARRDPLAAVRYLDSMPLGPERQGFAQIVARAYGRRDPAAALVWAQEKRTEPMLLSAVIAGVAEAIPTGRSTWRSGSRQPWTGCAPCNSPR